MLPSLARRHGSFSRGVRLVLTFALMAAAAIPSAAAADAVALSVDASKPGAKIDRHIFGQFAEHLGTGIYDGVWVGPTPRSPTPAASATTSWPRSRRSRCRTCAGRAGASPTSITGARASARSAPATLNPNWGGVIEPNSFGTHEFMDFVDQIGSRSLPLRQRRLGHAAGSGRVAGVPDDRPADGAGQGARRQRPSRAVQGRLPRPRQRELGLRRQDDAGVLHVSR